VTSLMDQFAAARQARTVMGAGLLAAARADRLANEQQRREAAQRQRQQQQQELAVRVAQVGALLSSLEQERHSQGRADAAERVREAQERAQEMRDGLHSLHRVRLAAGASDRLLRQRDQQQRHQATQQHLHLWSTQRKQSADLAAGERLAEAQYLTLSIQDFLQQTLQQRQQQGRQQQQQRQQEAQSRHNSVSQELHQISALRSAVAIASKQQRQEFCLELQRSVWAGSAGTSPAPKPATAPAAAPLASPKSSTPPVQKPPVAAAPKPPAPVPAPTEERSVQQFILGYVAKLPNTPTLGQVLDDRDALRLLLAQGAISLGIDPSEIVKTLQTMADA